MCYGSVQHMVVLELVLLTLTGRRALVINYTCNVVHTPTSFPQTAIIGMYACVA